MRLGLSTTLTKADKVTVGHDFTSDFYLNFRANSGSGVTIFLSKAQLIDLIDKAGKVIA